MAVVELYIDHTNGEDPGPEPGTGGDGTIGDPWKTLSAAFTNIPVTSAVIRLNVKNTSSGSKMTSLGTLPSGRAISTQVIVQPYSSAAGDTESLLFIDCGGGAGWTQPNDDAIAWNRCHFSNSGSTFAFDLDNNIVMYKCTFDATFPESDSSMIAWFCNFINQTGSVFKSSSSSGMYHCLVEGSGEATGQAIIAANLIGNIIYWAGSRDHLAQGLSASSVCINNSFIYDNATHATGDGYGYRADDQSFTAFNYYENCAVGIDLEGSSESFPQSPNAFYGNTANRTAMGSNRIDLALPLAAADYDLAASGVPNAGSGNYALSTELADLRTNQYTPFAGTSTAYEAYFGAPFKSKSGGTSGKQGLHAIESGSV